MSFIWKCCPCLSNKTDERKTEKSKTKAKTLKSGIDRRADKNVTPSRIPTKDVTRVYKVPKEFESIDDCLKNQGLKLEDSLGDGAFGKVFKITTKKGLMACKVVELWSPLKPEAQTEESFAQEIVIMERVNKQHINIVEIHQHFIIKDHNLRNGYIIMELAEGTVYSELIKDKRFTEQKAKHYFRQIANGLNFLHKQNIAHKDLKLKNVLVFQSPPKQDLIKLTDFGLSRVALTKEKGILKEKRVAGTADYMSPQLMKLFIHEEFGEKVDVLRKYPSYPADCWALGVCLYYMICSKKPFRLNEKNAKEYKDAFRKMMDRKYEITKLTENLYSKNCLDLIRWLLEPVVETRIPMKTVMFHKWLLIDE